jgi:ABC-type sugar transport system permease subunit
LTNTRPSGAPAGRDAGRVRKNAVPYLMLLPAMGIIAAFMFYPIFNTFWLSLQNHVLTNKTAWGFAGLDNFARLAGDAIFWKALKNTTVWTVIT